MLTGSTFHASQGDKPCGVLLLSKVLSFGKKNEVFFVFRSLNRTFEILSKVLSFGKKKEVFFVFRSLNRTFALRKDYLNKHT